MLREAPLGVTGMVNKYLDTPNGQKFYHKNFTPEWNFVASNSIRLHILKALTRLREAGKVTAIYHPRTGETTHKFTLGKDFRYILDANTCALCNKVFDVCTGHEGGVR